MTDCRFVDRHVGAFVDGEMDPVSMIDLERHVDECARCQERLAFEHRARALVQSSLGGVTAPESLRLRVTEALAREPMPSSGGAKIRFASGSAVAAAAVLFIAGSLRSDVSGSGVAASSVRPMLEDVVRLHSSALPADVPAGSPQALPSFFRDKVEFPVRPAVFDHRADVRFVGARYAQIHAQNAVALYYDVGGSRVTVVVYEAPDAPPEGVRRVRLGQRELMYDDVHGYAVPVRSQGHLHYAFTGDLDRRQMLELAAAARVSP